jgi:hypothetical protein
MQMEEPYFSLLLLIKGVRFQENHASFYNHPVHGLIS